MPRCGYNEHLLVKKYVSYILDDTSISRTYEVCEQCNITIKEGVINVSTKSISEVGKRGRKQN